MIGQLVNAATSGAIVKVADLVAGSFAQFSGVGPGPGTLQFSLVGTWTGTVQIWVNDGSGNLFRVPDASILALSGASGAVASGAQGFYSVQSPGGAAYIVWTAITGSVTVTPTNGPPLGPPGEVPSGGATVTANQGTAGGSPWPTTDSNGGASGTGIVQPTGGSGFLGWLSGIYNNFTNGLQKTQLIDSSGSPSANVPAGNGNGLLTNGNDQTLTCSLTGAQSATTPLPITATNGPGSNPTTQAFIDAHGYAGITVGASSIGSGVTSIVVQGCNDGTNWQVVEAVDQSAVSSVVTVISTTTHHYKVSGGFRYYRFYILNAQTSGTTTIAVHLSQSAGSFIVQPANSASQSLFTSNAANASGGYSYTHIAGATAGTLVKTGAATLHTVIINTKGVTATATIYDGTTSGGAVICVIDLTLGENSFLYDAAAATGIFVVITGTASDVTITWK